MGKKFYMVEEDRWKAHRQELIIANSYDEAYMAYCNQIVKPMDKSNVVLSRVTKKMSKHPDAPLPIKAKPYEIKEKERKFIITLNEADYKIKALSFEDAIRKFKSENKKFDKYDLEIRLK
jgi:hypothetical protein